MSIEEVRLTAVVVAHQSRVHINGETDYAIMDIDAEGECWARKLIRKLVSWRLFNRVILLLEEGDPVDSYDQICEEEGAQLVKVPRGLFIWPRSWYQWAWNSSIGFSQTDTPMGWIHWLQRDQAPSTYFVLNVAGGLLCKTQMRQALKEYRRGYKAILCNKLEYSGYLIDSYYLNDLYAQKFEGLPLICDLPEGQDRTQTLSFTEDKKLSYQSRVSFPLGLWTSRYFDLLKLYLEKYPQESKFTESNKFMIDYMSEKYVEHGQNWLHNIEIQFSGDSSSWIDAIHFDEICNQAQHYGRLNLCLDFRGVADSSHIYNWLSDVSTELFLMLRVSADVDQSLLDLALSKADYLELELPKKIDFRSPQKLTSDTSFGNWIRSFEYFNSHQRPLLGVSCNIPSKSSEAVAMIEFMKDRVEYNPVIAVERLQGAEFPRAHVIKYNSDLGFEMDASMLHEASLMRLNSLGQSDLGMTVYEMPLKDQFNGRQ